MASLFSEDVLRRTLATAEAFDRIAMRMAEMHEATKDESFGQWFVRIGAMGATEDASQARQLEQDTLLAAARRRLQGGLAAGQSSQGDLDKLFSQSWKGPGGVSIDQTAAEATGATKKVGDSGQSAKEKLAEAIQNTQKWMAVLGSAATPAEQLKLKILELNLAVADHAASAEVAARAERALEDAQTTAAIATREGLGLASQEELLTAGLIKLRDDYAKGYIGSAQEMEQAEQRLLRTTQEAFKQEQVANSAFKGLTQMSQGVGLQDVDKLATGMLNNLATTSVAALNAVNTLGSAYNTLGQHINATTTQTNAAKQAFIDFARQSIQSIEQVIFKMVILAPLLQGIGFGGGGGGGWKGTPGGTGGGLGGLFAEGGIMSSMGPLPLRRYAGGGVTDRPQLALFGEGSRPEAFVPLPNGRAIPAIVDLKGAGGGHSIQTTVNFHNNWAPGTTPEEAHKIAATFARSMNDVLEQVVDARIVRHLQSGGMLNL